MRSSLIPIFLLAAACSREPASSQAKATSALPPGPETSVAQAVPAGGASSPAVLLPEKSDAGIPATAPAVSAEVVGSEEENPELAHFEEEQSRRDAELMAQDSEEAQRQLEGLEAPRDDRYARHERDARDERYQDDERIAGDGRDWRNTERYRRYAEQRERYRGQGSRENEYPPEELDPYAQPEPWDEVPEGPEADEDYDPESGEYNQR